MSGRHALERTSNSARRLVPLLTALCVAVLLVAGAVAAMNLGPTRKTGAQAEASGSPVPVPEPSRTAQQRASRGELRAVPSSPSPSTSPSTRATKKAAQPSSGGTVTSTGSCQASYYGTGQTTANGEPFDPKAYTAANKTLPFNTRVRVTNTANGKSVTVRINDRGPFVAGRCLDLTPAAFQVIASLGSGVVSVTYQVLA